MKNIFNLELIILECALKLLSIMFVFILFRNTFFISNQMSAVKSECVCEKQKNEIREL